MNPASGATSVPLCSYTGRLAVCLYASVAAQCGSGGVEGGRKRRRGAMSRAVENGGAHECLSAEEEDRGVSPYLAQLRREARECEPTWSCGPKYVGVC